MYIQSELSFLCRLVALKSAKRRHDWLEQQGVALSSEQAIAIAAVAEKGELRQGELMGLPYLASEKSKVSRVVQGLVLDGLIHRKDDQHDRRSKILSLTEKGAELAAQLKRAEEQTNDIIHAMMSQNELATIRATLDRITRSI